MKHQTRVHLVRHGEVDNPTKILYGRLPGYRLSPLGQQMAERVAEWATEQPITHLRASPLERAQETAQPIADALALPIVSDERVIEATNLFEGKRFGVGDGALKQPSAWWHLRNPFRPSWGERYNQIVLRMLSAMGDARQAAAESGAQTETGAQAESGAQAETGARAEAGNDALVVSHQLPIWIVRSYVEGRRLWHDPRKRQCSLASITTFHYEGERIVEVSYAEPAADLLPAKLVKRFVAGA